MRLSSLLPGLLLILAAQASLAQEAAPTRVAEPVDGRIGESFDRSGSADVSGGMIVGALLGGIATAFPPDQVWIATTLKLGAAFYIAYLSLKIWKFEKSLTPESSITSRHVFITTLLNPKAFLFASFVMPPKVFVDTAAYFPAMGTFALTMIPVSLGWCLLGHLARSGSSKLPMFSSGVMLRGASLVLCFFSASILYDVLHKVWLNH